MTPIGLAANKSTMDLKFKELTSPAGDMYKAAYDAYYNIISDAMNGSDFVSEDTDIAPTLAAKKSEMEAKLKQDATNFATELCGGIEKCLEEISNQIDAHIKSMMITIVAPTPGPCGTVLACGVGPVTGTIGANNLSPTGGITIS